MSDNLTVFGVNYTGVTGIKAKGTGNGTLTYIRPTGTKSISANGTGIDVAQYASVDVAVPTGSAPTLQAKTATPTESQQVITPDSGYDGLSSVTVGAISSTYVGSGVMQRTSADLTRNAYTITAPAGYYAENASKTVERIPHATPTISLNSSTGAVTAVHSQEQGWVEGSGSGPDATSVTLQLSTQAAATITPTKSQQTAVAAGKYTTGAVTVAAIPSQYIVPSGSETKTANGTYDVTNLASVTVAIPIVTYHTSSSAPTSSQGSDGDLWLVTE